MSSLEHHLAIIKRLLPPARKEANEKGGQHPIWDVVFDAEALLEGRPTKLKGPRPQVILAMADWLAKRYPDAE